MKIARNARPPVSKSLKFVVGIDEVGRGPLAGPVSVCALSVEIKSGKRDLSSELKEFFKGARDSKKMSAKQRVEIFKKIKQAQSDNLLQYIVVNQSAKMVDKMGINTAISRCIAKCLRYLKVKSKETFVFLDGGLKAPPEFVFQKTIIRGDDKKQVISLASIMAKVTRDYNMCRLAKKYPKYGFEKHKGYGTADHIFAIQKNGLSPQHRRTFCKNIDFGY